MCFRTERFAPYMLAALCPTVQKQQQRQSDRLPTQRKTNPKDKDMYPTTRPMKHNTPQLTRVLLPMRSVFLRPRFLARAPASIER